MNIRFRKARIADLPLLLELLSTMDGEPPLRLPQARRIYRGMQQIPGYHTWLAFVGRRPVGTFALLILPLLTHGGAKAALLESVVVAPSVRGKGVGSLMLAHAMRLSARAGCYKLALSSNLKRRNAHRFYRAAGFRQHGVSLQVDPVRNPR